MKTNKGFTLLEVLITLVIISSFILGVNKILYTIDKANLIAEEVFQIINYSQNIMEYLKSEGIELFEGEYQESDFIDSNSLELFRKGISEKMTIFSNIKIEKLNKFSKVEEELYLVNLSVYWKGLRGENIYEVNNYISK